MISALLVELLPWALAIVAGLGAFWGWGSAKRARAETDDLKKRIEVVHSARDIDDDVRKTDDDAVRTGLAQWMRETGE